MGNNLTHNIGFQINLKKKKERNRLQVLYEHYIVHLLFTSTYSIFILHRAFCPRTLIWTPVHSGIQSVLVNRKFWKEIRREWNVRLGFESRVGFLFLWLTFCIVTWSLLNPSTKHYCSHLWKVLIMTLRVSNHCLLSSTLPAKGSNSFIPALFFVSRHNTYTFVISPL